MRALLALLASLVAGFAGAAGAQAAPSPIKHVWVIELENKSFDQAFVNNTNTYLWKTLPASGELLRQYYGTGHFSLDNYLSELSGQAPNQTTSGDCPTYTDVTPALMDMVTGQFSGEGCVYPAQAKTLVDQLEAKGLTWKGYMEDLGNDAARDNGTTCGAPKPGQADPTQGATATDQYAARHNPFVYFHSILDPPGRCAAHVGPLGPLVDDLKRAPADVPSFSFITPNLCNDAHDATPCKGPNAKGTTEGGLIAADAWLSKWVPLIMDSPAYKQDGMVVVTLDESGDGTSQACCNEPANPEQPSPGRTGPGGGRIGTVLLSPFIKPGTVNDTPYNHYSFLKSMEQLFGIDQYLGYANQAGLVAFGDDVYNQLPPPVTVPEPPPPTPPVVMPGPLPPGDAGSTGKATPLKASATRPSARSLGQLHRALAKGLRVKVRVTGSDRALDGVRLSLTRGSVLIGRSGAPRTLPDGTGTLTVKPTAAGRRALRRGTFKLVVEVIHERRVVAHKTLSFTLKR